MRKFWKRKTGKHGSLFIRIDEKEPDKFVVDIHSGTLFITKKLETDLKNVLKEYLS